MLFETLLHDSTHFAFCLYQHNFTQAPMSTYEEEISDIFAFDNKVNPLFFYLYLGLLPFELHYGPIAIARFFIIDQNHVSWSVKY
jgi:hypothetical protein